MLGSVPYVNMDGLGIFIPFYVYRRDNYAYLSLFVYKPWHIPRKLGDIRPHSSEHNTESMTLLRP
ncbi:hypothetical protein D3C78_1885460 [compost metagenome]